MKAPPKYQTSTHLLPAGPRGAEAPFQAARSWQASESFSRHQNSLANCQGWLCSPPALPEPCSDFLALAHTVLPSQWATERLQEASKCLPRPGRAGGETEAQPVNHCAEWRRRQSSLCIFSVAPALPPWN